MNEIKSKFSKKTIKRDRRMTASYRMLTAIKEERRKGITEEQKRECYQKSGILDKEGKVAPKYKDILKIKD